jgi:hypothetical protein
MHHLINQEHHNQNSFWDTDLYFSSRVFFAYFAAAHEDEI